jgi:hypothetical protein
MPPKNNPLKLNPLQLKTLVLLQEIVKDPRLGTQDPESGEMKITGLPHAHGSHMHVGHYLVHGADATGLDNAGVWAALGRKGLVRQSEAGHFLTKAGAEYETGMREAILHGSDH